MSERRSLHTRTHTRVEESQRRLSPHIHTRVEKSEGLGASPEQKRESIASEQEGACTHRHTHAQNERVVMGC